MPEGWTALVCDSCGGILELLFNSPPGMITVTGRHSPAETEELAEALRRSMEKLALPILVSDNTEIELVKFDHPLLDALRCVNCKKIYRKNET